MNQEHQILTTKELAKSYGAIQGRFVNSNFFEAFQAIANRFGCIARIKIDYKTVERLCIPGKPLPTDVTLDTLCTFKQLSRTQRRLALGKRNKI